MIMHILFVMDASTVFMSIINIKTFNPMTNADVRLVPPFFNYKEEKTDNGYETMIDFNLSWIFRWADEKFKDQNPRIHNFGKQSIFFLIYGQNINNKFVLDKKMDPDFRVFNVKTKRQFNRIDLLVECDIEHNLVRKKYILNIENKWYSPIHGNQLESSIEAIQNNFPKNEYELINLVIFLDLERILFSYFLQLALIDKR